MDTSAVEGTGADDESNILLNQDTVDYYGVDSEEYRNRSDSSTDMSFAIEPGQTRRYHRCFKVNICLNITMLLIFVSLIIFSPWYSMSYSSNV